MLDYAPHYVWTWLARLAFWANQVHPVHVAIGIDTSVRSLGFSFCVIFPLR